MEKAVSVLEGHTWKNKQIRVKVQFKELVKICWRSVFTIFIKVTCCTDREKLDDSSVADTK